MFYVWVDMLVIDRSTGPRGAYKSPNKHLRIGMFSGLPNLLKVHLGVWTFVIPLNYVCPSPWWFVYDHYVE